MSDEAANDSIAIGAALEPLTVGRRQMHNRVVQAPMSVSYADEAGRATRRMAEHYGRRAQGGIGMVITENVAVSVSGRQMPKQPMLAEAAAVKGFAEVADEIHRHGALAVMQIVHAGRYAGPWSEYDAARRLAPSAVTFPLPPDRTVTPAEITVEEIERSLEEFVTTATLAKEAGFDGVELHGAQGFLISSFLSPGMNRRTDEWGGSLENRARFALQALTRVRAAVPDDFIVGMQLMSDELKAGGWTIDECETLVPMLGQRGVDFLLPVVSTFESLRAPENEGLFGRESFQHEQTQRIKAVADDVPVFANGGIRRPELVDAVVRNGEADAVAMARPLFADPDWLAKTERGEAAKLRLCDCTEATCLRTQLTGSICQAWPEAAREAGYLGYAS